MSALKLAAATAAVVAGLATSAQAVVTIYAMNNLSTGPDTLVSFQSNNPGVVTTIGSSGVADGSGFTGLDFAGVAGQLYGWVGFGAAANGLYSINVATGAATKIGAANTVGLNDMSWDPVTNQMYGVTGTGAIHSVNLATGATTLVGTPAGLPAGNLDVGLAHDSLGRVFIHDIGNDEIYRGTTAAVTLLHDSPPIPNTNFSQGMTIDWAGDDRGYHAAIGNSPAFFSRLYNFGTNVNNDYLLTGNFDPDGAFPTFEGGDLAIRNIPEPTSLALVGLAGLGMLRRRRA